MTRVASILLAAMSATALSAAPMPEGDWRSYGRDPGGTRFSPLKEIDRANVASLREAWTYDMRAAAGGTARLLPSQMTPLAVGGIVYLATPYGTLVALDGDSGRTVWSFALPDGDQIVGRGLEYWPGDGGTKPRILFGTRTGKLLAVDADSGSASAGFTPIMLKTPEVMAGSPDTAFLTINSAPIVSRGVIITGSRVQESPALGPNGDVRGWDARTGKLLWTFRTIPRAGEPFGDSWGAGTARRSGVNVWNLMTVDTERDIAYLPIAAPAYDRIGVDRPGDNLFSSAIVAVDAKTGKRLWHFQTVHHDIWDLDVPGQPTLLDVRRDGKTIPAVAVINKTAILFLLDRVTGKPIYPVREVAVPPSTIPGEQASPTQPIPSAPPPLGRQAMTANEIADITPEHRAYCEGRIRDEALTFAAQYEPLRTDHATIRFPGSGGGANWGGAAYDPSLGLYVINTTEVASVEQLGKDAEGNWTNVGKGSNWFADRRTKWMCQQPPWGRITAVDVHKGTIAWSMALGVTDDAPEGRRATGRPNVGGPILTAGGVTFVGATDDSRFRAFDTQTGKELWTTRLPAAAHATPITFAGKSGRQYVATVAAGGSYLGSPARATSLIVFALPEAAGAQRSSR